LSKLKHKELIFTLNDRLSLYIPRDAYLSLLKYRQNGAYKKEAGGIVLGRVTTDERTIIVDEITTPFEADKRARHSFYRSSKHNDYAVKRWKESKGDCVYLGLWHTHPESYPNPSSTDFNDWKESLLEGVYLMEGLFYFIVGTKEINCWYGTRTSVSKRFLPLRKAFVKLKEKNN